MMVGGLSAQTWRTEPTDDTYSKASKQTVASGDEDIIYIKNSTGGEFRRDGYMRFDLSACNLTFPAKSVVVYLYTNPGDAADNPVYYCYRLNGPTATNSDWTESTLVSSNKPGGFSTAKFDSPDLVGYLDLLEFIETAEEGFYPIDITEYANAQKAAGSNEISFIIRGNGSGGGELKMYSKEAEDPSVHPYLEVSSGTVGVSQLEQQDQVKVTVDKGCISLENVEAGTLVELYTADGVCLKKAVYNAPIPVGNRSGVCILKIYSAGKVISKKIAL